MAGRDEKTPAGRSEKEQARRARQAEALRRNLARRKAQARSRAGEGAHDQTTNEKPSDN